MLLNFLKKFLNLAFRVVACFYFFTGMYSMVDVIIINGNIDNNSNIVNNNNNNFFYGNSNRYLLRIAIVRTHKKHALSNTVELD